MLEREVWSVIPKVQFNHHVILSHYFHDYIPAVKSKFGLPDVTELDAFDETNTVVEEDIFSELIEASPYLQCVWLYVTEFQTEVGTFPL